MAASCSSFTKLVAKTNSWDWFEAPVGMSKIAASTVLKVQKWALQGCWDSKQLLRYPSTPQGSSVEAWPLSRSSVWVYTGWVYLSLICCAACTRLFSQRECSCISYLYSTRHQLASRLSEEQCVLAQALNTLWKSQDFKDIPFTLESNSARIRLAGDSDFWRKQSFKRFQMSCCKWSCLQLWRRNCSQCSLHPKLSLPNINDTDSRC